MKMKIYVVFNPLTTLLISSVVYPVLVSLVFKLCIGPACYHLPTYLQLNAVLRKLLSSILNRCSVHV